MRTRLVILFLIIIVFFVALVWQHKEARAPGNESAVIPQSDVVVDSPKSNQAITSPVQISGKAKGAWFFEATFPVKLLDQNGTIVASGTVRAQGNWQTADYVNFSGSLSFTTSTSTTGSLEFSKDNPSGLPQNAASFFVPVQFTHQTSSRPSGTCAPDAAACNGDAKLCMEENKNVVCD